MAHQCAATLNYYLGSLLAVLALLVGALAPNQAVAGMALPMYTTSLLCEASGQGAPMCWHACTCRCMPVDGVPCCSCILAFK